MALKFDSGNNTIIFGSDTELRRVSEDLLGTDGALFQVDSDFVDVDPQVSGVFGIEVNRGGTANNYRFGWQGNVDGDEHFVAGPVGSELPVPRISTALGAGVDGYALVYDNATGTFELAQVDTSNNLSNALPSAYIFVGNESNIATGVAVTGDITIDNAGVVAIASGVIVDADISGSAAIAFSKLAPLTSGNILVGNGSNVAASVAFSGDGTLSNTGAFALGAVTTKAIGGSSPSTGHVVRYNGSAWASAQLAYSDLSGTPSLVTTFIGLTDTPNAYAGAAADADKFVVVNGSGDGLVFTNSIAGDKVFEDTVTIQGDLIVQGTTTSFQSQNLTVTDRLITVNNGEVGAGVSGVRAGIEVDRGSLAAYAFLFEETTDTFRVGEVYTLLTIDDGTTTDLEAGDEITGVSSGTRAIVLEVLSGTTLNVAVKDGQAFSNGEVLNQTGGSGWGDSGTATVVSSSFVSSELQPVATRQDSPESSGVAYWDATNSRFLTKAGFTYDLSTDADDDTLALPSTGFLRFGGDTNNSWRIGMTGGELILQKRISGTWETLHTFA